MSDLTSPTQTVRPNAAAAKKRVGIGTRVLRICLALGIAAALVWAGFWTYEWMRPSPQVFILGQRAIMQGDIPAVEKYGRRLLSRDPESKQGFLLMGMAAAHKSNADEALDWFAKIPDDYSPEAADARSTAGYILLHTLHQPTKALAEVQRGLDRNRNNPSANGLVPEILRLGTRAWETIPYELWIAKFGGQFRMTSAQRLYTLNLGHAVHPDPELLKQCAQDAPDDPIVQLGLADVALSEKRFDDAERHYRNAIASDPKITEARVRLGQVFVSSNSAPKFYQWNAELPKEADAHPLSWAVRGEWADAHGEPQVAMRCYWEAIRIDPNHRPALDRIGKLLIAEKREADAKAFIDRVKQLDKYSEIIKVFEVQDDAVESDIRNAWAAANVSAQLGLMAEALGWVALVLKVDPQQKEALAAGKELEKGLQKAPPVRTAATLNPTKQVDLSKYPLPNWTAEGPVKVKPAAANQPSKTVSEPAKAAPPKAADPAKK